MTCQIENERQRLNTLLASVPVLVWETWLKPDAAQQRTGFVSDYITTMLGYSVEEWLATSNMWRSVIHPDDRERVERRADAKLAAGQDGKDEFRLIAKDGRVVWVEVRTALIRDAAGNTLGVRGVTLDITERKQAEARRKESEERYRDLFENANDVIYTLDLAGKLTSVNRAGERLFGYAREELLGRSATLVIAPEQAERMREMLARKLGGESLTAYEIEAIDKRGRRLTLEINSRLLYEHGRPVGVQGIARDVTERQRLEAQLRQAQKLESTGLLAGGVAHDFNNLLTAIQGNAQLALRQLIADDHLRERLDEIDKAAQRAAILTQQLLAFGRRQYLERRAIKLNETVAEIMQIVRRIMGANVEVRIKAAAGLLPAYADPAQVERVVMNLAINARDAMPQGGTLTLELHNAELDEAYCRQQPAARPGRYVEIRVSDTGVGMDAETRARIFEPFFTTKEVGSGTGLGLATVYGIVKQHEGHINVYSEPGQGTTFKVYFPVAPQTATEVEALPQPPLCDGTETILLADDEAALRTLAKDMLEHLGYRVLVARNGAEAVQIFEAEGGRIELLLFDLVMPQLGGREAYEQIRALDESMPVIFMTGYSVELAQGQLVDRDMSGEVLRGALLQKPYSLEALGHKVREVLDARIVESARPQ